MTDELELDCRKCGARMDVEKGLLVDVVRCPTEDCPAEGARGPLFKLGSWVRRRFL